MTPSPIRILSLGDSYTIGESVAPEDRWSVQLAARLLEQGILAGEPWIIARTGWRTDELLAAMDQELPTGPFDLVTLLIGVNNQYQGGSIETFRADTRLLLERSIALSGNRPGRVLMLSIPDWGVTPYASTRDRVKIAQEIDAFNLAQREEAEKAGVLYVEITSISRQAGNQPGWLAEDQLHPSRRMYSAWVDAAFPVVLEVFR